MTGTPCEWMIKKRDNKAELAICLVVSRGIKRGFLCQNARFSSLAC